MTADRPPAASQRLKSKAYFPARDLQRLTFPVRGVMRAVLLPSQETPPRRVAPADPRFRYAGRNINFRRFWLK